MARKHRMVYPGMYHVVNRGVERRKVFLQAEDYDTFLSLLQEMLENFHTASFINQRSSGQFKIIQKKRHTSILAFV